MNSDYFQHIIHDLNVLIESDSFQQIEKKLMGENLLSQFVSEFESDIDIDLNQVISLAYRIEQIAIRLWENNENDDFENQAITAFEKAAKIFEYLAETQQVSDNELLCSLYFHSALNFSLGEFQANAYVIANKALGKLEFDDTTADKLIKTSFLLLQKKISQIQYELENQESLRQDFDNVQEINLLNSPNMEVFEDIGHFLSTEAILFFSRYLQNGFQEDLDKAQSKISSSLGIFNEIRDPENFILTKLISLLFRQIHNTSVWHQLGDLYNFRGNPILARYLRMLTNSKVPIYELWKSQIDCLNNVLTHTRATVISLPTSAGKTRIAELKIVHTLSTTEDVNAKCIYIAPYKALAAQIERSLLDYLTDVGFRVSSIFGSYESVDVEDFLIDQSDVLVMTPEKLDYLYRQQPELFDNVKLIIVDEGHLLDDNERGLRLEVLLHRLQARIDFQTLLISAVIPNGSEIAEWLGKGELNMFESKWKPTKLRQGIFYWGKDWEGRIHYIDEQLEIVTDIHREIIQTHHKNNPQKLLKEPKWYPDTKYDIAIELAVKYKTASPTIIFTAVRAHVDSIARSLSKRLEENDFELNKSDNSNRLALASWIESVLGEGFPLAKYIQQGFAYHHGLLPDNIRLEIEDAFKKGYLPLLIATPTLAQGVNLPIKLMLVAHLDRGSDYPFLVRDFRNIAGRAGRALYETEGQVLLLEKIQSTYAISKHYRYLHDSNLEPVISVLLNLYNSLFSNNFGITLSEYLSNEIILDDFTQEDNPSNNNELEFQIQLLSIIYEDLVQNAEDENGISELLDNLLFGYQCRNKKIPIDKFKKYTQNQIGMIFARLNNPARREAYYRTGLSILSCESLELKIREKLTLNIFTDLRNNKNELDDEKILSILELVEVPKRTRNSSNIENEDLQNAMLLWLKNGNIIEISKVINNPSFGNPLKTSDLVYKHFMTNASWVLNSVLGILSYLKKEENIDFDPEMKFLPAYMKFGVDTPVATYMLGLNIGNRDIAKIFSEYYRQNVNPNLPSMQSYVDWLTEITMDELEQIVRDEHARNEFIVQLNKFKDSDRPSDYFSNPGTINMQTYIVGVQFKNRLDNANMLNVGDNLILERDISNEFDYYALKVLNLEYREIGFIRRTKAFILSTLIDEGFQFSTEVVRIYPETREIRRRFLINIKYSGT